VSRVLVLDGAMATLRLQTGLDAAAIHHGYLDAGADIIRTDTFMAADDRAAAAGARIARAAADAAATPARRPLVAGVIGVDGTGIDGLIEGGVDLLLAETLTHTSQIEAILGATAARPGSPPLMISVAVTPAGRLPSGQEVEEVIAAVRGGSGLYSLGVNCGSGVDGLYAVLSELAERVVCRVSCHPAAGLPDAFGLYDEPPALIAAFLRDAAAAGLVDIVGGCCGTTPDYIAAIAGEVGGLADRMLGFRE
jgi:5-methyltetrahydrofolate--homocysteine methyltransferase